ncbi:MAG: oxidoreductase [Actinomycetota bacterium]|nr:oxidoreductase [Actinomycetota bacterium]
MPGWTVAAIPDLTGTVAVVTGANSGLGYQTSLQLAAHGAHVVLASRDRTRGEQARVRLAGQAPRASTELLPLDLADLSSVRRFAAAYEQRHERCDLLVDNAGVMAVPRARTADGFESQLGINHLGHFALTGLLLPRLLASADARVVTVSSLAHRQGVIHFDDLSAERGYTKWGRYGQAKLANLLFAFELQRRADAAGVRLRSVAAHPGLAATELFANKTRAEGAAVKRRLGRLVERLFAQSDAAGALPILYAATMPDVVGGEYFGPDGPGEMRGHPRRVGTSPTARDPALAARLWDESERLTGVRYTWSRLAA